jgi:hypothetical protein
MVTALLLLGLCSAPADSALDFVQREVRLASAAPEELPTRLARVIAWDALTERVLGDAAAGRTEDELRAFRTQLEQRFKNRFARPAPGVSWRLLGLRVDGLRVAAVATLRRRGADHRFALAAELTKSGRCYQLVDMTVDNVSAVRNMRAQVQRLIERRGWDGMMAEMAKP